LIEVAGTQVLGVDSSSIKAALLYIHIYIYILEAAVTGAMHAHALMYLVHTYLHYLTVSGLFAFKADRASCINTCIHDITCVGLAT